MAQQQNNFDFDAYNKLVNRAPAGLKIFLATQMFRDVVRTLEMFDNPLEDDARGVLTDMKLFRETYKAAATARAEKTGKLMASDGESE